MFRRHEPINGQSGTIYRLDALPSGRIALAMSTLAFYPQQSTEMFGYNSARLLGPEELDKGLLFQGRARLAVSTFPDGTVSYSAYSSQYPKNPFAVNNAYATLKQGFRMWAANNSINPDEAKMIRELLDRARLEHCIELYKSMQTEKKKPVA